MYKPISLVVILVIGLVLLVINKTSDVKYERNSEGGAEIRQNNVATNTAGAKIPDQAKIIYTNSGFEPAVTTIRVGGTVEFVNKSADKNFMPVGLTNQVKKGVFKLEEKGEFGYTAFAHPERLGVIVVN